jgi:hypothetical protein
VKLVEDHYCRPPVDVIAKHPDHNARCSEQETGARRAPVVETDPIPDRRSDTLTPLGSQKARQCSGRDSPGLDDDNLAVDGLFEPDRDPRGLARAGRCFDDYETVCLDGIGDGSTVGFYG